MQYVLGAYSQIPVSASENYYEVLLEKQLKPLLMLIHKNPDYYFLLRLDNHYYDWMEQKYPEINLLISELVHRGQLELLSGASNNSVLSLVPVNERSNFIENCTLYLKKMFKKKPAGYFSNYQIFNTSTINAISAGMLKYMVISSYNQITGKIETQKPFYTSEFKNGCTVFPTDDAVSKLVHDYYKNGGGAELFLQSVEKYADSANNSFRTIMLNLDQLVKIDGASSVFSLLYEKMQGQSTTPSLYLKEKSVSNVYYLPSSIYGRDFNAGGVSSVNSIIIQNPVLYKNLLVLQHLREITRSINKANPLSKQVKYLLEKADSGACYIDTDYRDMNVLTYSNRFLCKTEAALLDDDTYKMPLSATITNPFTSSDILYTKDSIAYIEKKGAVIQRFAFFEQCWDFAFCEGGIFQDSVRTRASDKPFPVYLREFKDVSFSKNRSEAVYFLQNLDVNKNSLSIKKTYTLGSDFVNLGVEIHNLKDANINSLFYETKLCLNLGKSLQLNEMKRDEKAQDVLGDSSSGDFSAHLQSISFTNDESGYALSVSSDKTFEFSVREAFDSKGRYKNHVVSLCFHSSLKANGFEKIPLSVKIGKQ